MNKINTGFNARSIVAAATQDVILSDGEVAFSLDENEEARGLFNCFSQGFAMNAGDVSQSVRTRLNSQLGIDELIPLTQLITAYVRRNAGIKTPEQQRDDLEIMVHATMPDIIDVTLPAGFDLSAYEG